MPYTIEFLKPKTKRWLKQETRRHGKKPSNNEKAMGKSLYEMYNPEPEETAKEEPSDVQSGPQDRKLPNAGATATGKTEHSPDRGSTKSETTSNKSGTKSKGRSLVQKIGDQFDKLKGSKGSKASQGQAGAQKIQDILLEQNRKKRKREIFSERGGPKVLHLSGDNPLRKMFLRLCS